MPAKLAKLAQLVRHARQERGLTVTAVADRAGLTKSYVSMLENDRLKNPPSRVALARLEAALSLEAESLVRVAAVERMPQSVRQEIQGLADAAERGRLLAQWLQQHAAAERTGTDEPAAAATKLDDLYRSGELHRRVAAALGQDPEGIAGPAKRGHGGGSDGTDGVAELVRTRAVPLINRVAAGYPTGFTDLDYPARVADETVSCPGLSDPDAFAARVVGDSMQPTYHAGDIVVFSPLADVTDGSDCFVRLEPDHESTFKRVFFEPDDRLRLQPLNPSFAPRTVGREQVAGMYKAVWCMKPLG